MIKNTTKIGLKNKLLKGKTLYISASIFPGQRKFCLKKRKKKKYLGIKAILLL